MPLQLDDLAGLDEPTGSTQGQGQPLMLPIELIDEDPDQPRREFDADALQELADTIRERGVRQPISVRPHVTQAGRWTLNFGARRLRASKLASKETIPAFIDSSADSYDQVIENEQREGLRPLDLALFIERRLALNESQNDIARKLGKSQSYVARASALIDAPDWLMQLYRQGRCDGLNEVYLLRRLHAQAPDTVTTWLAQQDSVTRAGLQGLKLALSQHAHQTPETTETTQRAATNPAPESPTARTSVLMSSDTARDPKLPPAPLNDNGTAPRQPSDEAQTLVCSDRRVSTVPQLMAQWRDHVVAVVMDRVPALPGAVYVRKWPLEDAPVEEAMAADLKLSGFASATQAATHGH